MPQDTMAARRGKPTTTTNCKRPLVCPHAPLVVLALLLLLLQLGLARLAQAQCPNNTMTSFERIGSVAIKDSLLAVLYTAPNASAYSPLHHHSIHQARPGYGLEPAGGASGSGQSSPITAECNNRCRRSSRCRAFLVDYARHTCYSVEHPSPAGSSSSSGSSMGLMRTPPPIHLVPTQERTSYFEKVCLSLPAVECERAWVYERVMGHHLQGHDDKVIEDVPSRLKCQEYCLNEPEFRCRSGEYDYLQMQCRLSMVDRHLKPNAFRPTANNVDYFENQCVPVGNQCDAFDQYEDMDLGRAEIMRLANTSDQCQQFCTQTIKAFICRSFTWNPLTGRCYLNSANSFMVGGLDRLIRAPGLIYYQRNDCIDLKLECDTTAMTLNLRTNEPFRGRMYVRDEPNACEVLGRSSLTSSLSIPFQSSSSHGRCAVREPPNRFSSVVVVQQHPMIQRKSDRYIKVVCDFQTANKTITSSYNVVNNPWTSTALINATSFAPKIRLRITDKFGVDITGAKLGDELYLRIEAETESVYDMVARSVLAKSGITDESIMLIDKDGCPTDFRIFPSLRKLNRRTIVGKFDAFKFSSDVVVRFQVDVQFCLNQCPSTTCDNNLLLNSQLGGGGGDAFDGSTGPNGGPLMMTTVSPLASQGGGQSTAGSMSGNSADSSLVTAFSGGSSSTQPPAVPYQQRGSQSSPAHTPVPMMSLMPSADQRLNLAHSNYSHQQDQQQQQQQIGQLANQNSDSSYYYSSNTNRHQHPSMPANSPMVGASPGPPNFTGIMDLLSPAGADPQMFEQQSQPRSGPLHNEKSAQSDQQLKGRMRPKTEQQLQAVNSISEAQTSALEATSPDPAVSSTTSDPSTGSGSKLRRRRRSAEPMPRAPSHVPLQREIIVESGPGSQQVAGPNKPSIQVQGAQNQPQQPQQQQSRRGGKSSRRPGDAKSDGVNRNGPAYDLNGNPRHESSSQEASDRQEKSDNGTLLCTTRHSLVIASMAFCTLQLFTIALCMVTWMHRRDTKFKVRHQVEQRLY